MAKRRISLSDKIEITLLNKKIFPTMDDVELAIERGWVEIEEEEKPEEKKPKVRHEAVPKTSLKNGKSVYHYDDRKGKGWYFGGEGKGWYFEKF